MGKERIRNVEIKARVPALKAARNQLMNLKARFIGLDHQIDTYFAVNSGRLKLRQGTIENHLIFYQRPDQDEPKLSEVLLYPVAANSPMLQILTEALGVEMIVDKEREIFFIDHVKFHLDLVIDLGTFVEIEVIDQLGDMQRDLMTKTCQHYMKMLGIDSRQLVSSSYADLLKNA